MSESRFNNPHHTNRGILIEMSDGSHQRVGLGWVKDHEDYRDHFVTDHPSAKNFFSEIGILGVLEEGGSASKLPSKVSLKEWCPPVLNQGHLGSCTAHAGTYLAEIISNRLFKTFTFGSRLFLYWNSRLLAHNLGNEGSTIRATLAAGRVFGIAPEMFWPYDPTLENVEPRAHVYSIAEPFQFSSYARLSKPGMNTEVLINLCKSTLAHGFPFMGGVVVYSSFMTPHVAKTGKVPFPGFRDRYLGGHALCFVGYDDNIEIRTANTVYVKGGVSKGAFIFENSWGINWGDKGYGYLPYDFFKYFLVTDIWTLYNMEYLDMVKEFGIVV